MKKKDAIVIVISVVIFVMAGGLLYRYLAPPTQKSGVKVIIPHPVDPNFNQEQLNVLKNDVTDYSQNIAPADSTQSSTNTGQKNQSTLAQPNPARN
jgi:LPS O-antigen subunit length determinant protein (WzzB/FepE family)